MRIVSGLPGRRGVTILWLVVVVMGLCALASFAVDYGYVSLVKTQLRSTLDAASLAGVSGLAISPTEARTRAKAMAAANKVNGVSQILLDSDIELGTWNFSTKSFTVLTGSNESKATSMRITARLSNARGTQVKLVWAKLLGRDNVEMQTSSVAAFAAGSDVLIVQDVTTSFSSQLADAKVGDQALLDALKNGGGKGAMGVVAFTGWGKTIAPLQNVGTNYATLKSAISSLKLAGGSGMPIASGTDLAAGLIQGIAVFDAFTSPSPTGKALILVTDGESTQDSDGSHPNLNASQLLALAKTTADQAWAKKINVYVVFYNASNSASAITNMKTLTRGSGTFVSVTNASLLPAALEAITKNLPVQLCK